MATLFLLFLARCSRSCPVRGNSAHLYDRGRLPVGKEPLERVAELLRPESVVGGGAAAVENVLHVCEERRQWMLGISGCYKVSRCWECQDDGRSQEVGHLRRLEMLG